MITSTSSLTMTIGNRQMITIDSIVGGSRLRMPAKSSWSMSGWWLSWRVRGRISALDAFKEQVTRRATAGQHQMPPFNASFTDLIPTPYMTKKLLTLILSSECTVKTVKSTITWVTMEVIQGRENISPTMVFVTWWRDGSETWESPRRRVCHLIWLGAITRSYVQHAKQEFVLQKKEVN